MEKVCKKIMVNCIPIVEKHHAGTKLSKDLHYFMKLAGYESERFDYLDRNRVSRLCLMPYYIFKAGLGPAKGSELVFLYPYDLDHDGLRFIFRMARPILRWRKVKLTALIFDLDSVRLEMDGGVRNDVIQLQDYDKLISHSPEMTALLRDNGYKGEIVTMGLFDYRLDVPYPFKRENRPDVCFGGNLLKSEFLPLLKDIRGRVKFLLYGPGCPSGVTSDNVSYHGILASAEDLSGLDGSWGLVWDGPSIDGISGSYGRYMDITAPHKASMYLAARMPLIVGKGTALSAEVQRNGIGIVVDSLTDIAERLASVSDEEYGQYLDNVDRYADEITSGRHLAQSLSNLPTL